MRRMRRGLPTLSAVDFIRWLAAPYSTKHFGDWDAYAMPEVHYSFARSFQEDAGGDTLTVSPGFGGSLELDLGFSIPLGGNFRIGARLQPMLGASKRVSSNIGETVSSYQLSWDSVLEVSYLIATEWSATASYTDQTLMGPAVNSTLSRSFALALQHRWPR